MVREAILWMFGYYLWLAIIVTIIGLVVGAKTETWNRRWTAVGIFAVVAWIIWPKQMSPYATNQEVAVWACVWTTLFGLAVCAGVPIGTHMREQTNAEVNLIPEAALLETVEHLASLPMFASMPWFARRWADLSREDKASWITSNQADIRRFISSHGGLETTPAADLVVELQRIDRQSQG